MSYAHCICHGKHFRRYGYRDGLIKHYEDMIQGKYKEEFKWKERYHKLRDKISDMLYEEVMNEKK